MAANVTTATTGSLTGAAVGAATGSIAGPPGAVAGAIIGGAIGAVAGAAIGADQDEKTLRDEALDRELGVIVDDATDGANEAELPARGRNEPLGPDRD